MGIKGVNYLQKKKYFLLLLSLSLTACQDKEETRTLPRQTIGVNEVLKEGMESADLVSVSSVPGTDTKAKNRQSDTDANRQDPQTDTGENAPVPETVKEEISVPKLAEEDIDIDLTVLSSTMVYSQVFQMIVSPDDFMGKTIKIGGICTCYHSSVANKDYYSCYVQDAAACCSQGIAFTLNDSYSFPDEYPINNEEITLIGVFGTYQEGKYFYPMILNASLV